MAGNIKGSNSIPGSNSKAKGPKSFQFGLFRGVALWLLLTYVCVYWLARDPCLARGGVLTAFVCGTDDSKVFSILDLAGTARVVVVALIMGALVAGAWTLARRLERASREDS